MKKLNIIIINLLLTLLAPLSWANTADSLMNAGNMAYQENQFKTAIACYTQIDSAGYQSVYLYYNLGNAWLKNGSKSNALLWYERALRLRPGDEDIRHNIAFVNQQIIDRIETLPQIFILQWWNNLSQTLTSNGWAIASIACTFIAMAFIVLILLTQRAKMRKTLLFLLIVTIITGFFSVIFSAKEQKRYQQFPEAIVMEKVVSAKSAPSDSSKELFVIHEGLKVAITDYVGAYIEIRLSNGEKGWILSETTTII